MKSAASASVHNRVTGQLITPFGQHDMNYCVAVMAPPAWQDVAPCCLPQIGPAASSLRRRSGNQSSTLAPGRHVSFSNAPSRRLHPARSHCMHQTRAAGSTSHAFHVAHSVQHVELPRVIHTVATRLCSSHGSFAKAPAAAALQRYWIHCPPALFLNTEPPSAPRTTNAAMIFFLR